MNKLILVFVFGKILGALAFWSLDTDLQLGYEIYDRSYEINAAIQAISTAATRNYVIQTEDATKIAVNGLNIIASQLKSSPVVWYNEIAYAASSRTNTELFHIQRIRSAYVNHNAALNALLNETGPLSNFGATANPSLVSTMRLSLIQVQYESTKVMSLVENITGYISIVRTNSSLLLTPELLSEFIDSDTSAQITSSLVEIRNSFIALLAAVRDVGRLVVAHGSVHDQITRSHSRDVVTRNSALNNFVSNYNRVRGNLLTSVSSYRQTAISGIQNFISRVLSTYDDSIVRPKFDQVQLPLIRSFSGVIASQVYNQTFFETSFDAMRDLIVNSFTNLTNETLETNTDFRAAVLDLQRFSFVQNYSQCLDELVTEAQVASYSVISNNAFCLNERTNGIIVVIPSVTTWLGAIKDNINFILQQLNSCLNGLTSVAGRTSISDCIQVNANNLVFYSGYLPVTVEANLRPVVQGPPIIFNYCINQTPLRSFSKFEAIYENCKAAVETPVTLVPEEETTEGTIEQRPTESATDPSATEALSK